MEVTHDKRVDWKGGGSQMKKDIDVDKRLSAAAARLKKMEILIGSDYVINEQSDFPEKSEWIPSDATIAEQEYARSLWD